MKVEISDFKDDGDRDFDIEVSNDDTYSLDHTLSYIIYHSIVKFKEKNTVSPMVDDDDVSETLKNDGCIHKRWEYVIDEMIWAFKQIYEDNEEQFYSGEADIQFEELPNGLLKMKNGPNDTFEVDREGMDSYSKRIANGTRLFGKYYRHLWW